MDDLMFSRETDEPEVITRCDECGLPYTEFGLDVTLSNSQWQLISKGSGLLCANCIVSRAEVIPGAIAARMVIEISPQQEFSPEVER